MTLSWETCRDGRWILLVRDTGPGIAGDAPFAQVLDSTTRDSHSTSAHGPQSEDQTASTETATQNRQSGGGEGIGLTIVKKLCELLDATVELDSSNTGCEFRVIFSSQSGE